MGPVSQAQPGGGVYAAAVAQHAGGIGGAEAEGFRNAGFDPFDMKVEIVGHAPGEMEVLVDIDQGLQGDIDPADGVDQVAFQHGRQILGGDSGLCQLLLMALEHEHACQAHHEQVGNDGHGQQSGQVRRGLGQ